MNDAPEALDLPRDDVPLVHVHTENNGFTAGDLASKYDVPLVPVHTENNVPSATQGRIMSSTSIRIC